MTRRIAKQRRGRAPAHDALSKALSPRGCYLSPMMRIVRFSLLSLVALSLTSCAAPVVEIRRGDAPIEPARIVLLPASCASLEGLCIDAHVTATTQIVGKDLSFAGFLVVDAEKLAVDARLRPNVDPALRALGERVLRAGNKRQIGMTFEDLAPTARKALLDEGQAQGAVSIRLTIDNESALGRDTEVMLRYGHGESDALAFVSRCRVTVRPGGELTEGFAEAARCALEGALSSTTKASAPQPS
jgi:hypothetical protein